MDDWFGDEVETASVFTVVGALVLALMVFTAHTYWSGYTAGRCEPACGDNPATLWPDGSCSCGRPGVGTVP